MKIITDRFRNDPVPLFVGTDKVGIPAERLAWVRPDVRRRFFAEKPAVTFERLAVPIVEFVALTLAAFGWMMMQRFAQHLTTEIFPVRFRVDQVQVPRVAHLVRGCRRMSGRDRQKSEPLVFADDSFCVRKRPTIVARQPFGKREGGGRSIE